MLLLLWLLCGIVLAVCLVVSDAISFCLLVWFVLVIWCVSLVFPGFVLIVFGVVLGWFALWSELVVLFCWYLVACLVFALLMFGWF